MRTVTVDHPHVLTAWLQRGYEISTMLKSSWTLDGKLPAQAQQFASMTWRRSRKSSKVSKHVSVLQMCNTTCCIMSFSDEHSSGLSECFHHIQAQKTWRKWRFCSSTYFLSYSALLTSFSCPWNNETFCKKDNKDQFDREHEVCLYLTASAVASSKESKAAKSCLCFWSGSLRLYSRVLSTEAHWLLGGPGHFPLGCLALLELWGRINLIKADL